MKENIKAPRHWPLCGEFTGTGEFPAQMASNAENVSIWWRHHERIYIWIVPCTWVLNNRELWMITLFWLIWQLEIQFYIPLINKTLWGLGSEMVTNWETGVGAYLALSLKYTWRKLLVIQFWPSYREEMRYVDHAQLKCIYFSRYSNFVTEVRWVSGTRDTRLPRLCKWGMVFIKPVFVGFPRPKIFFPETTPEVHQSLCVQWKTQFTSFGCHLLLNCDYFALISFCDTMPCYGYTLAMCIGKNMQTTVCEMCGHWI